MYFEACGYTDIGTTKKSNQDSYCIKIADTDIGQVALVAVADGMGGLQKGELASGFVIQILSDWFENDFKDSLEIMNNSVTGLESVLTGQWSGLVQDLNLKIMKYGMENRMSLGTTLTAMLTIGARYSIIHVGDSRVYEITDDGVVSQMTEDQTFVHREIKAGRMTIEEAAVHPKRNVLLQCIGSSKSVVPQVVHGNVQKNACYLLCSDGFRHMISDDDLLVLQSCSGSAGFEKEAKLALKNITEKDKIAGESDNITAAVLRVNGGVR